MTFTVWNSADKAAGITLSGGDTIATGSGGNNSVRGTTSHASNTGKFYLEYHSITQVGGSGVIGFENGTVGLTTSSTNGEGVSPGGNFQGHTIGAPASHVVCLAIDTVHLTAWERIDGGNWNGSPTNDPATNVGGVSYSGMSGGTTVFPFVWLQNGGTVTIVTDSSLFSFAAPTGFDPWDGAPAGATANGVLLTATTSLIAGGALTPAPGSTITDTVVFIPGDAHLGAIDGHKIYEFIARESASEVFQVSDFDSIYSRGDRVANGLLAGGEYGWTNVFSPGAQGYDNVYSGNGPAANSPTQSRPAFWVSSVGGETLDVRGFRLIGADTISSYENFWAFYGGVGVGNYSTLPYFKTLEAYNPNQGLTGTLTTPTFDITFPYTDYFDEPKFYSPWPHYEFVYLTGTRPDVRWANEVWFKIAHSNLDGGERRPGHAAATKTVVLTLSADWGWDTTSGHVSPAEGLLDGEWEHENDKLNNRLVALGAASNFATAVTAVGAWLQFQFPRPVIPKHLQFINFNSNTEVFSAGNPTKFGKWHWEVFNELGVWAPVGTQWWFRENCVWMVAPQVPGTDFALGALGPDGQGYTKWRMVLDAGPAFGNAYRSIQVQFDLVDVTGQAPPFEINFTDDTDSTPAVVEIGNPGSAYVVPFTDGSEDGLTLTLSNTPNPVLTVDFTDDGQFDTWSDLYPSIVVQTVLVTTGR